MVIMTRKRYKKDQAVMYGMIGASSAVGMTGAAFGIAAFVKSKGVKTDVDRMHTDIERRLSAEEGMSKQFSRAISQVQSVLEKNDMLRMK